MGGPLLYSIEPCLELECADYDGRGRVLRVGRVYSIIIMVNHRSSNDLRFFLALLVVRRANDFELINKLMLPHFSPQ